MAKGPSAFDQMRVVLDEASGEPLLAPAIRQLMKTIPVLEIFPEQHSAVLQRLHGMARPSLS
jgi:hypothetical protein